MRLRALLLLGSTYLAACPPETIVIAHREVHLDADITETAPESDAEPEDAGLEDGDTSDGAAEEGVSQPERKGCVTSEECGADRYCAKASCDELRGECTSRDTVCTSAQDPVCGCDGLSYFNDCVRRTNGVAAATPGECLDNAVPCDSLLAPACPAHAVCGRLKPSPDPSGLPCEWDILATPGKCWVLPGEDCAPEPFGGERYVPCLRPSGGSSFGGGGTDGGGPGGGGGAAGGGSFGGGGILGTECVSACEAIKSQQVHIRVLRCQ